MQTITGVDRDTRMFMHANASALALASETELVVLDLGGHREDSPGAQKTYVAEKLAEAVTGLDRVIRTKKNPPARVSVATSGRKLAEFGEVFDAVAKTYTPSPAFHTLVESLMLDAAAAAEKSP